MRNYNGQVGLKKGGVELLEVQKRILLGGLCCWVMDPIVLYISLLYVYERNDIRWDDRLWLAYLRSSISPPSVSISLWIEGSSALPPTGPHQTIHNVIVNFWSSLLVATDLMVLPRNYEFSLPCLSCLVLYINLSFKSFVLDSVVSTVWRFRSVFNWLHDFVILEFFNKF